MILKIQKRRSFPTGILSTSSQISDSDVLSKKDGELLKLNELKIYTGFLRIPCKASSMSAGVVKKELQTLDKNSKDRFLSSVVEKEITS